MSNILKTYHLSIVFGIMGWVSVIVLALEFPELLIFVVLTSLATNYIRSSYIVDAIYYSKKNFPDAWLAYQTFPKWFRGKMPVWKYWYLNRFTANRYLLDRLWLHILIMSFITAVLYYRLPGAADDMLRLLVVLSVSVGTCAYAILSDMMNPHYIRSTIVTISMEIDEIYYKTVKNRIEEWRESQS